MKKEAIASDIEALLPERPNGINNDLGPGREAVVEKKAEEIIRKETAKELTQRLLREKKQLAREQARAEQGIPAGRTAYSHEVLRQQEEKVEALEALQRELDRDKEALMPDLIEQASQDLTPTRQMATPTKIITPAMSAALQTTTRADVAKLLTSLNINLNLQLSKTDTANLLACLLTCNEAQLAALISNPKVPVVIKTVIKRLQEDMKHGYMSTIESLWDRIFGKAGMMLDLPQQQAEATGIIPGQPISREAYIILRDTLIK